MNEFDPRLLRISIEIDGKLNQYTGLALTASITKFANPMQNQCTIKISNLTKSARDYLLTETSPFNRPRRRKKIIVEAGRVSTGYFKLYEGDIVEASPSQPPDIQLTLKAATAQWYKTEGVSVSYPESVSMETIAKGVAESMGLSLQNEATDKQISNYSYSGSKAKQVDQLAELGYTAHIDDETLHITDRGQGSGTTVPALTKDSGMIGIPEITEQGVKVRFLLNPQVTVGTQIFIKSEINPAVDGYYIVFKLNYEVANRDTAFYCNVDAQRVGIWQTNR